jgi:ring-1,2-phenylacetyl-CoA epoxidase subunit PaaC
MSDSLVPLLIALGDDELILGHRHSEWTGWAPHIEEDVAFSSIAQDEIGHAAAYYRLAASLSDRTADEIAFGRKPDEYHNALLCERPNGDWAYTLARHWLYDHADDLRLESLQRSSYADLANLATKIRREERYHLLHADTWMQRIALGPVEGRSKLVDALAEALVDASGLWEPLPGETASLDDGTQPDTSADLRQRFFEQAVAALDELGLPGTITPELRRRAEFVASSSGDLIERDEGEPNAHRAPETGGRTGVHSPDFEPLWEEMTRHYRAEPGATW